MQITINNINQIYKNKQINRQKQNTTNSNLLPKKELKQQNNYAYKNLIGFKSKNISIPKLYEEYNWYINCDRTPAINSFLKIDAPKEILNEFFTTILNTTDRGYQLIDSIVANPRQTTQVIETLTQKLGNDSPHLLTFIPNTPYKNAYDNYIETKYQKAKNLTELLKVRPDWNERTLLEKYKTLAGNDNLKIGNIPRQISKEHAPIIFKYLKSKMLVGGKFAQTIENLVIDGKTYEFTYFTEGKSSKNVFGVFVPSMAKKYVFKIDAIENRSLDAPFALGTLAKIDKYLTAHRCRNSAPLCYYDHENNYSIYKFIEHTYLDEKYSTIEDIVRHIPDFKSLNLQYHDTLGYKNFFKLQEKSSDTHYKTEGFKEALGRKEWISVDNDHVTYNNRLQPLVGNYHSPLPNAMQMFF